jgi:hypothetical protein
MMYEIKYNMSHMTGSQKSPNLTAVSDNASNECNMLVISDISNTSIKGRKSGVNKMLSVLIFLIVK